MDALNPGKDPAAVSTGGGRRKEKGASGLFGYGPGAACVISPLKSGLYPVQFGGRYKECWSEDYVLSIEYEDRKTVDARWAGDRWVPAGGEEYYVNLLNSPDCPVLVSQYFQAAASVNWALGECRRREMPLDKLRECFFSNDEPIAAPELMRRLMDDEGLPMDKAYQVAAQCCSDLRAAGVDVEQVYPLQPRTAHVVSILRGFRAHTLAAVHDGRLEEYRFPPRAAREGELVTLAFRVLGGQVKRASLLLFGDGFRHEFPMEPRGEFYTVTFATPVKAAALWYAFRIEGMDSAQWLCPDESGYFGRLYGSEQPGFRLTVFRQDFDTPAWFRRSIMYQIFPDRFAFSADGTAERGIEYHLALGQRPELHKSLDEPVRYLPRPCDEAYSPDDFYGGTLRGIEEKLPYLKELGISCLYLNPVVEARSNHRYDSSDYMKIDPILGSNEDFASLCGSAEKLGIRLILDGVFSHTGADSVYFNRGGRYPGKGACQGPDSEYYSWYDFKRFPDEYRCWWGFGDLPEVDEGNGAWQDFVIKGGNSVVKTWLRRGASGWRLDVADELPDDVLGLIRSAAREEKPDAVILGEVWEDAVIKESYGGRRNYALGYSLDTVMNYPFRSAVLDFIHRRTDAYALRDFLISQRMNYPEPMYYSLMNLLGSHDVERLSTALATPVVVRGLSREEQLRLDISESAYAEALERERLCAVLQYSLPGVPSLYYGDEQGMRGVCDPFNRLPFREGDRALHDLYAELGRKRASSDVLSLGRVRFFAASRDLLLVLRYILDGKDPFGLPAENGVWLAAINRGPETEYEADLSMAGLNSWHGKIGPGTAELIRLA